jgi:hypothetical protein
MKPYGNLSQNSGVIAYEIKPGSIVVQFEDGLKYEYTEVSAGAFAVAEMKRLAKAGQGLSTFISQHVRQGYARKFR